MKKQNEKHYDYYEAILQLRPATDKIVDFVASEIEKRGNVKISKVVEMKNGIDIYLTNQKFARSTLGPMLKRKFKGELKISKSLYGRDKLTQKLVYRATVLFRFAKE